MMKGLIFIALTVVFTVESVPIGLKEEAKRRETTKETLELENALKRLAGENKKFYPGPGLQPVPQVDGLEDPAGHSEDAPPAVLSGLPENPEDLTKEVTDDQEESEDSTETEQQSDEQLKPVQNFQSEVEENTNPNDESNNESDQQEQYLSNLQQGEEPINDNRPENEVEPMYYNNASPDITGQDQQNFRDMYNDIYKGDYPQFADGDIDGDGTNEDYLVQDVISMMEQHPELWARLLQARNMVAREEDESDPEYEMSKEAPVEKRQDSEEQDLQNVNNLQDDSMERANELYNNIDEEALQKMKALQQYENLQDLYGDKDAHVVAKKQGYGPVLDIYQQNYPNAMFRLNPQEEISEDVGSGEDESPKYSNNRMGSKMYEPEENSIEDKPTYKIPMM